MRRGPKHWVFGKDLSQEEMLQLKDEKEEPHEDHRAGTAFQVEEAVSAEPGSREVCCVGQQKGWKVVAKG